MFEESRTSFEDINSLEFINELKKGSPSVYEKLVDRLLTPLRDFLSFGKNVPELDAEEMAADVLVIVHGKIKDFQHNRGAKLTTWIFQIAKNRAIDYHRTHHPDNVEFTGNGDPDFGRTGLQFAGRNQELLAWLHTELGDLSIGDQNLLKWRALDFPYSVIAEWLGITEGAARVRHKRAMERLIAKANDMAVRKGAVQP